MTNATSPNLAYNQPFTPERLLPDQTDLTIEQELYRSTLAYSTAEARRLTNAGAVETFHQDGQHETMPPGAQPQLQEGDVLAAGRKRVRLVAELSGAALNTPHCIGCGEPAYNPCQCYATPIF